MNWCMWKFGFALLSLIILSSNAERILSVTFMSSKSHKIVFEPLLLELAKRGHQVTIVTPIPSKKNINNIREVLAGDSPTGGGMLSDMFETKQKGQAWNPFLDKIDSFDKLCRNAYDDPEVKKLMSEKFDLIIYQPLRNDCAAGFVHHFKAPVILIGVFQAQPMLTFGTGTPSPPSFIPHWFLPFTDKMSYYERMINFAVTVGMDVIQNFYYKPKMTAIYREKLCDPNIPTVNEILSNSSLILSNYGHFSLSPPKPFLPDTIEVGGMHCRPAQPLPKDLEDFAQSSGKDGFIFFSMGSVIQAHTMPEKHRKIFVSTFAKLKLKVLWKWETDEIADLPKNVKIAKWLPQQDILGHSKLRLFLTHGGYGGITEAVYHGAPLVGIPMFGDQMLNMQRVEKSGFALTIGFNELTEEKLLAAINRILKEPSFNQKAKSLSKIFQDQPDKPLDRAVFWTEYVLRHKGAVHMRSAARELNFFQYHSIDVMASYAAVLFAILYTIFALGRALLRKLLGKKRSKNPSGSHLKSS